MWFVLWVAAAWADDSLVVARRDLYPGVVIEAGDVVVVQVTTAGRAAFPADALIDVDQVVGRFPRERVLANEAVRAARLHDPTAPEPWQAVPSGSRAFAVRWSGPDPARGDSVVLIREGEGPTCRIAVAPVLGTAATAHETVRDVVLALSVEGWVAAEAYRASGLRAVPLAGAPEAACR